MFPEYLYYTDFYIFYVLHDHLCVTCILVFLSVLFS